MAHDSTESAVPKKLYSAYTVLTVVHRLLTDGALIDEGDVAELMKLITDDLQKRGGCITDAAFSLLDMLVRDYSDEFEHYSPCLRVN